MSIQSFKMTTKGTHLITDINTIKNFVFGGKAVFTLRSKKTDKHYSFAVRRKPNTQIYWVSVLCGPSNFEYNGYIAANGEYRTTNKSTHPDNHITHKVFNFLLRNIDNLVLHPDLEFYHVGKCGVCGRPLTDPVSIEAGIGPTCRKRVLR